MGRVKALPLYHSQSSFHFWYWYVIIDYLGIIWVHLWFSSAQHCLTMYCISAYFISMNSHRNISKYVEKPFRCGHSVATTALSRFSAMLLPTYPHLSGWSDVKTFQQNDAKWRNMRNDEEWNQKTKQTGINWLDNDIKSTSQKCKPSLVKMN